MKKAVITFIAGFITASAFAAIAFLIVRWVDSRDEKMNEKQMAHVSRLTEQMQSDLVYTRIASLSARASFAELLLGLGDDSEKTKEYLCASLLQFMNSRDDWFSNDATGRVAEIWLMQKMRIEQFIQSRPDIVKVVDGINRRYELELKNKEANKLLEPTATTPPPSAQSGAPLAHP